MASMVTRVAWRSSRRSSAGMATIPFDFSATAFWPVTITALTGAEAARESQVLIVPQNDVNKVVRACNRRT